MKHFNLGRLVILAVMLLMSVVTKAQETAPANMKAYRGNNGSVYTFQVTGKTGGRIWGGSDNVYTDDSEIATAAVHAGVLRAGQSGTVRIKVLSGRSSYPSLSCNGVTSIQYGSWDGSYQIVGGNASSGSSSNTQASAAPANMKAYRGKNGNIYTFQVTGKTGGRIWGGSDNVYTDDSEIATAAVHAGVLRAGQSGTVRIQVLSGRSIYPSLSRNGVTSNQYGSWDGSYQILSGNASSSSSSNTQASAAPANMKAYRGKNGSVYTFQVTGKTGGRIWGGSDNVYTDDSDIATAAVHAGLVSPGGTTVIKVTVLSGRSSYPSLSRNGVTSIQYGSWDGSYRLSR